MNANTELEQINQEVIACKTCPRLVTWREQVAREKRKAYRDQEYWGKPVPGFGDPSARVFVVGLAPGAHGSNRTGRQFTGDASGNFLYPALYRAGFANQTLAVSREDGLALNDLYTAPVCRCAPPDNKPRTEEIEACLPFLERELKALQPKVIVVLGRIAFDSVLKILSKHASRLEFSAMSFSHNAVYVLPPLDIISGSVSLVCSYHPSQQNTLTGRLTVEMFDRVWMTVKELVER